MYHKNETVMGMFFGAKPAIFEKAKWLRENMTATEKLLWDELKGNKILKLRFKPQHPIDVFIADFYCHKLKLVIEIDGGVLKEKSQKEYDIGRTVELAGFGIKVIRLQNEEVQSSLSEVIKRLKEYCVNRANVLDENGVNSSL